MSASSNPLYKATHIECCCSLYYYPLSILITVQQSKYSDGNGRNAITDVNITILKIYLC